jgi:hypothetical protein
MVRQIQEHRRSIPALKVHQWLRAWGNVNYDAKDYRRQPEPHFYMFKLPAAELLALSGIYRRSTKDRQPGSVDLGIQRRHEPLRSAEIQRYVEHGYPWSSLPDERRKDEQFSDLQKPGWLPTAIVVNILTSADRRNEAKVKENDLININNVDEDIAQVLLPSGFSVSGWTPSQVPPLEIIDGQHRLWAFEDTSMGERFELPIVGFYGLDISWQAYLFWTINIRPKRINPSLAFDLYPLLRSEDWLDRFEGHPIYRETRAQELTETLWSHSASPWFHRINMLGDPGAASVSQAAWIRSLMATYVKSYEGQGVRVGGLFGARTGEHQEVLPWSRAQQAAFLIFVWQKLRDAVRNTDDYWAAALRELANSRHATSASDPAFTGAQTLLNTDQGVRGVLHVTNDLCYSRARQLRLASWEFDQDVGTVDDTTITRALQSLEGEPVAEFLTRIAQGLAKFDWRTSSASLTESERLAKLVFRGSGGYRELRRQLLNQLTRERGSVKQAAQAVKIELGYE